MKKLRLIGVHSQKEELLRELMLLGCVEVSDPAGRPDREELAAFLRKTPGKRCPQGAPLFSAGRYREFPGTQVRRLRPQEVEAYLAQR